MPANATAHYFSYDITHSRDKQNSRSTYFDCVPPCCATMLVYNLPYPMVWNEAYSHDLCVWPCLPRTTAPFFPILKQKTLATNGDDNVGPVCGPSNTGAHDIVRRGPAVSTAALYRFTSS